MSRYVYGDDARLLAWAEERLAPTRFREDAKAIGHERDGEILATVVYDAFTPTSCCVSIVSDRSKRWFTREFAIRAMAYPFVQCGFNRITCFVSTLNTESLRFTGHFGWTHEGVLREAGEQGEDVLVFGMLRRECRWLAPILPPLE